MNVERNYDGKLLNEKTPFAINEAFKMLRTNLFYTSKGEKCPVYGISSTFANSGKSLVISNLAISFAQLGRKVLLLDCDLRNSVIHKIFGLEKANGMSDLLAGVSIESNSFIKNTGYENLSVITAGGTPPNPAELLASERTEMLISALKEHFDIIFIDLPPILVVSDAAVIADCVTGYLFAVRSNYDNKKNLKDAVDTMEQTGAKIIGFVLNDVDIKSGKKYGKYGYGKYGKYGYGKTSY